jgi:hypothetical protein
MRDQRVSPLTPRAAIEGGEDIFRLAAVALWLVKSVDNQFLCREDDTNFPNKLADEDCEAIGLCSQNHTPAVNKTAHIIPAAFVMSAQRR